MTVNEFWIPLLCIKNKKLGTRLEKNICRNSQGSYNNQEEWLEEFNNERAFYNDSESDDSDNDDEDYNENIEAFVCRCSKCYNGCYKIVSLIVLEEVFNHFAVCVHCMEPLFVEDVTSSNYIFQKGATRLMDEPRTCRTFMLLWIKSMFFNKSGN